MELYGEIPAEDEGLGRAGVARYFCRRVGLLPAVVMPLEPFAPRNQRFVIGGDLDPAELRCCGPGHRSSVRCGEQLPPKQIPNTGTR